MKTRDRNWRRDAEGWWNRPLYRRDAPLVNPDGWTIGTGQHALIGEDGRLCCRTAKQRRRLDNGLTV